MAQWVASQFGVAAEVLFLRRNVNPGDAGDPPVFLSSRDFLVYLFSVTSQRSEFNQ